MNSELRQRQLASLEENRRRGEAEDGHRQAQRAQERRSLEAKIASAHARGRTKAEQVTTRRMNLPSNARGRR